MSKTFKLFDSTDGDTIPGVGDWFTFNRRTDEVGLIQVEIIGGTGTVNLQARAVDTMPAGVLLTVDETDTAPDPNDTVIQQTRIMPQMRINVASGTATQIRVWVAE